jgi:AraC-like DNA-binding protein
MTRRHAQYFTPPPDQYRTGLACLGIGAHSGPKVPVVDRVLDTFQILLVEGGTGWVEVGGARTTMRAPATLTMFPGVRHSYSADAGGWAERWVLFGGSSAAEYVGSGILEQGAFHAHAGSRILSAAFDRMAEEAHAAPGILVHAALGAMLHELVVRTAVSRHGAGRQETDVLAALQRSSALTVSIAEHARLAGVTPHALGEIVSSAAQATPKQYVLSVRISEAKRLLARTTLPIGEVAARVGYADAAYFSRVFRRRVGETPSAFRDVHWVDQDDIEGKESPRIPPR